MDAVSVYVAEVSVSNIVLPVVDEDSPVVGVHWYVIPGVPDVVTCNCCPLHNAVSACVKCSVSNRFFTIIVSAPAQPTTVTCSQYVPIVVAGIDEEVLPVFQR